METDGRKRVVIENIKPTVNCGEYPIKRIIGQKVQVSADVLSDGHDTLAVELLYRSPGAKEWQTAPFQHKDNDRWESTFTVDTMGSWFFTLRAWIDHFTTWQKDLELRLEAGQDVSVDLLIGAELVEEAAAHETPPRSDYLKAYAAELRNPTALVHAVQTALSDELAGLMYRAADREAATRFASEFEVWVERSKALFSTWYELFPRSASRQPGSHGNFKDVEKLLPDIAAMGFDVLYLPPIHPIGKTNRKGKNNAPTAEPDDPGSPWAIGAGEGGHTAVHPQLGTMEDFAKLLKTALNHNIEIALDMAFQCSQDHPWVKSHPEWFRWRPDGTVQYAENPPKKYQDVLPLNFENEHWKELWEELRKVVLFWIDKGVRIFRVDNPHTKPFGFWEWLIREVKNQHPEIIFLAEAFTRPKVMYRLAKVGFTQSYTYFTWRNTREEFVEYLTELTRKDAREFFRPNFWTNTPDILPENLQLDGRPGFITRLVLAATLSSSYGIYGPSYELCENTAIPGKEEYQDSEKYEVRHWDRTAPGNIRDIITRLNQIRKENLAFHSTWNVDFYETDNHYLLCYGKYSEDLSNIVVIVVSLDYFHNQAGTVDIPVEKLGIPEKQTYLVHELLEDQKFMWQGGRNYVELDPTKMPARIFRIHRRLRRENDFDYYL